jgi:hypothetical protein
MPLPKFNLNKLRESVSAQQSATKKDIANLLLLDRLKASIGRQKKTEEIKKIDFNYRVRVWHNSGEGHKTTEIASYGPISQDKSFCNYLEDEISRLKKSGQNTYFAEEFIDEIYGVGCDEFEDTITIELAKLDEYGEESDTFFSFTVHERNAKDEDEGINITISVQRY